MSVVCLCFFGYQIYLIKNQDYTNFNEIERIKEKANMNNVDEEQSEPNFSEIEKMNANIVAWLYIPDTTINYPIVQGSDNSYYLTHTYLQSYNYAGAIFMDYRQDLSMPNVFVYGHNVYQGTMFADIEKFKDERFFKEHTSFYLWYQDKEYELQVMSFYQTTSDDESVFKMYDSMNTNFLNYANECKSKSMYEVNVDVTENDKMITFVTCSYESGKGVDTNLRYVLHTKMKERG